MDKYRITITVTEEIDKAVCELRKTERFVRASYAEIVRYLLIEGIAAKMSTTTT